jgi:carotenoid cleavage dioxygenase
MAIYPEFTEAQGTLTRWRLDLATGAVERTPLLDLACEFPRIDDRYAMKRHTQAFLATASQRQRGDGGVFHEVTHLNLESGATQVWDAGLGNGVSEPVFVPRHASADEGDGWLLATVYEATSQASSLVILDATAGVTRTGRHRQIGPPHTIWFSRQLARKRVSLVKA